MEDEVNAPQSPTKVVSMGNITELVICEKKSRGSPCKRISKDSFLDTRTGEVRDYQHIEDRSQSEQSMRHTLERIRGLVNTNVTEPENVRWITLTYAENMTDAGRLYSDFRAFWKKFKRWCKRNSFDIPEYITVQEPQGRGAWHVHAFFIWKQKAPFVPNDELAALWGQGFTSTKAVSNCDNIGAYFSAYLGDMAVEDANKLPLDERGSGTLQEKTLTAPDGTITKKRYIKGGRLHLYPPGMNIVRRSRGIREPDVEYMPLHRAKERVSGQTETFSRSFEIVDDNSGEIVNRITKKYYNSKRRENQ